MDHKQPLELPTPSPFRLFCRQLWEEHRDEVFSCTGKQVAYTSYQFFSKNKYYIKSLYKARIGL